jgi:hypothetical protein
MQEQDERGRVPISEGMGKFTESEEFLPSVRIPETGVREPS